MLATAGFRIAMQLIGDAVYGEGRLHGEPLGSEFTSLALGNPEATKEVLSNHVLVHAAQSPKDHALDVLCGEAVQGVVEVPAPTLWRWVHPRWSASGFG